MESSIEDGRVGLDGDIEISAKIADNLPKAILAMVK